MPTDKILKFSDYVIGDRKAPGVEFELPEYYRHYNGYLEHLYRQRRNEELPLIDVANLGDAVVEVNHGRWVWQCPGCHNGVLVQDEALVICYQCSTGGWHVPNWPANRDEIEEELLKQPGHRLFAPIRNWEPGWSMEYLRERTAKAWLLIHQGSKLVRALSIGTARVWVDEEILYARDMNLYVSDLIDDLAGRNGEQELEDSLRILDGTSGNRFFGTPGGTTAQRPGSPRAGMIRWNKTNRSLDLHDGTAWRQVMDTNAINFQALLDRNLVGSSATTLAYGNHVH